MKISDLGYDRLTRALQGEGLAIRSGCFTVRVSSPLEQVARGISTLYAEHDSPPIASSSIVTFASFPHGDGIGSAAGRE